MSLQKCWAAALSKAVQHTTEFHVRLQAEVRLEAHAAWRQGIWYFQHHNHNHNNTQFPPAQSLDVSNPTNVGMEQRAHKGYTTPIKLFFNFKGELEALFATRATVERIAVGGALCREKVAIVLFSNQSWSRWRIMWGVCCFGGTIRTSQEDKTRAETGGRARVWTLASMAHGVHCSCPSRCSRIWTLTSLTCLRTLIFSH